MARSDKRTKVPSWRVGELGSWGVGKLQTPLSQIPHTGFILVFATEHSKNKIMAIFENEIGPEVIQKASNKYCPTKLLDSKDEFKPPFKP